MIEILDGFPDNVIALTAKGRVTKRDYEEVLIPKVTETLARHRKIRCYYEVGPELSGFEPGAMWEDLKLGVDHLPHWERVAVVADIDWIRVAVNIFRFLVPGKTRVFSLHEAAEARRWIGTA
jgi:hypothetical protein